MPLEPLTHFFVDKIKTRKLLVIGREDMAAVISKVVGIRADVLNDLAR